MQSSGRVFGLDLLRALAVLFVMYGHSLHILPDTPVKDVLALPVLDGVTLFFVLSGFLIGRILLKTIDREDFDGPMLLRFWIRRWFRTLPNYYLVLTTLVAATYVASDPLVPLPPGIGHYFSFTQNLAWPHPEFFGEAWSLAVEEWFYLCIPIPLYLATRLPKVDRRRVMLLCATLVIVLSAVYRIWRIDAISDITMHEWLYWHRMQVITRMDSLMYGVLGAYLSLYHKNFWANVAPYSFWPGIAILVLDRAMYLGEYNMTYVSCFSLTVAPLATLLLLPRLSSWHATSGVIVKVVTFTSLTSYSLYLVNQALVLETINLWRCSEHATLIKLALYWSISVGGAFLLYSYFEKPVMDLRDRWSRKGHAPAQAFQEQGTTAG